ncbi:hypothetical protein CROQUDRAFT_324049 [Cronartium quercuum f. sp. fusiforme G11]|uniref:Uncharacterized protein n=1 Tax=Cronartium quercuum f. sp. fusiforme G11 TaxID=708437 RepID=A0A9P6NB40_9BASI|nr:hypothetical protein CROQUDRAFT_324049 [Cronartium quercuum f. sp. fusiforme G11]
MDVDITNFYKQRQTCCLVVPLFSIGLMTILCINSLLYLFASCMAFFGPKILALVQPLSISYIFGSFYALLCCLHIAGAICVHRDLMQYFRHIKNVTMGLLAFIFLLTLIMIIVSSARHSVSEAQCLREYGLNMNTVDGPTTQTSQVKGGSPQAAMKVCDIFSWIQIGVMGLSWMILATVQIYFLSKHKLYNELNSETRLTGEA